MKSPTDKPIRKIRGVIGASIVTPAALALLVAWLLPTFFDIDVPAEIALVIGSIIAGLAASVTGYWTSNAPGDFNHRVKQDEAS